jgi:hypothetical protein
MTKRLTLAALPGLVLAAASAQTAMPPPDSGAVRPNDLAIIERYMTTVTAELTAKIDTRNAGAGQEIAAKVSTDAQLADGTKLPKGTKLLGRLDQVQPQHESGGGAVLALTFDRAEPKSGKPIPLRTVLEMVGRAANPALDQTAGGRSGGRDAGLDDGRGGLTDPVTRGTLPNGYPPTAVPTGRSGSRGRQAPASPAVGRPDTLGDLDQSPSPNVERPVVRAGDSVSNGPRRTGVPGVVLVPNPAADVSGMLTSSGGNITLESGTQITLRAITR